MSPEFTETETRSLSSSIILCHTMSALPPSAEQCNSAGNVIRYPAIAGRANTILCRHCHEPPMQLPSACSGFWLLWGFSLCFWYLLLWLCCVCVNLFSCSRVHCAFLSPVLQVPATVCSDAALLCFPAVLWSDVSRSGHPHPRPFHAFAFFSGGASTDLFLAVSALWSSPPVFSQGDGWGGAALLPLCSLKICLFKGSKSRLFSCSSRKLFLRKWSGCQAWLNQTALSSRPQRPDCMVSDPFPGVLTSVLGLVKTNKQPEEEFTYKSSSYRPHLRVQMCCCT